MKKCSNLRSTKILILSLMKTVYKHSIGKELRNSPYQNSACTTIITVGAFTFHRCLVIATPWTRARGLYPHTVQEKAMVNHCCIFFSFYIFHFYLKNPMMRESKTTYEIVLKDETPRSESTQSLGKSRDQVQIPLLLMTQLNQN